MLRKYAHNNDIVLSYILWSFTFEKRRYFHGYGYDMSWHSVPTWGRWRLTATYRIVRSGWRVSNLRRIHETDLLTCSSVIGFNWWIIGRKASTSLEWSARASGGRSLGADLVIECYAKIKYIPFRVVFNVGLPGVLLRSGELCSVNRVDGVRFSITST